VRIVHTVSCIVASIPYIPLSQCLQLTEPTPPSDSKAAAVASEFRNKVFAVAHSAVSIHSPCPCSPVFGTGTSCIVSAIILYSLLMINPVQSLECQIRNPHLSSVISFYWPGFSQCFHVFLLNSPRPPLMLLMDKAALLPKSMAR